MPGLLDHNTLVINQKAKLIEITDEYKILDENGQQVGSIREVGQNVFKKLMRALTHWDQFFTHKLDVYEQDGSKALGLVRPRAIFKSRVEVHDATGQQVGTIKQHNVIGKLRFDITSASGEAMGKVQGENWRAWDFRIEDTTGAEVGRITKKWAGILKEGFTTADNYVFNVSGQVSPEMRKVMLATAAGIDLALKQTDQ